MDWKNKMAERRQRQEAVRYFRSNNPEYFNASMWLKLFGTGLGLALLCGCLYALFVTITHIHFTYILCMIGFAVSRALKKVAGTGNQKIAILTVGFYVLSIIFSYVFYDALMYFLAIDYGNLFSYLFDPAIWKIAIASLADSGILTGIVFLIGGIYAYQDALS